MNLSVAENKYPSALCINFIEFGGKLYVDRDYWRLRRKLIKSGLCERDRWAIAVDARRLRVGGLEGPAVEAFVDRAILLYQRIRNLDADAQKRVEAVEWQLSALPASDLTRKLEACVSIYALSDKKLIHLWMRNKNSI